MRRLTAPGEVGKFPAMIVRGHVKWFDTTKGYGFVVSSDGDGDILLHGNVLRVFGFTSVAEGAEIVLRVQTTERGRQAVEVLDIVPAATPAASPIAPLPGPEAAGPLEPARVKWFDRVKGFGFVNIYGRPEDVFLHMETLRQYGYGEVQAGDVLAVRVTAGPRGPMVYEVRSWDYVARENMLNDPGPRGPNPDDRT
jgi:cold shock protein